MSAAVSWADLTARSRLDWPLAGVVLALHAVLFWGFWQAPQPAQRLEFGSPMMVRFIEAPPAPKPVAPPPAPKVQPPPEPEPKPQPKPEPRVERPPVKEKPLITQSRPRPVPRAVPKPAPPPKPAPAMESVAQPAPVRSAPAAEEAKEAPITPPNILAAYQDNPPPVYPMRSRRLGEEGEVLLRVHITAGGQVDRITVERSCGHSRLDEAALEAVRDWRFAPARRGQQPVAAWVLVPIQFELS